MKHRFLFALLLTEVGLFLRDHGVTPVYLPKYIPELNAIELMWSLIKRRYKALDRTKPWKERGFSYSETLCKA